MSIEFRGAKNNHGSYSMYEFFVLPKRLPLTHRDVIGTFSYTPDLLISPGVDHSSPVSLAKTLAIRTCSNDTRPFLDMTRIFSLDRTIQKSLFRKKNTPSRIYF